MNLVKISFYSFTKMFIHFFTKTVGNHVATNMKLSQYSVRTA